MDRPHCSQGGESGYCDVFVGVVSGEDRGFRLHVSPGAPRTFVPLVDSVCVHQGGKNTKRNKKRGRTSQFNVSVTERCVEVSREGSGKQGGELGQTKKRKPKVVTEARSEGEAQD